MIFVRTDMYILARHAAVCIFLLTKMEDTINTQGLFGWLINGMPTSEP
jgi:hypothetical protein